MVGAGRSHRAGEPGARAGDGPVESSARPSRLQPQPRSRPPTSQAPATTATARVRPAENAGGMVSTPAEVPPSEPRRVFGPYSGGDPAPRDSSATPPPWVRICPGCGQTFETDVPTKIHCGLTCKQRTKRRRREARKPPPPPRPASPCIDCGVPLEPRYPTGPRPKRCAPCRAHRASEIALQRRREEYAAKVRLLEDDRPPWWRRWSR